MQGDLEITVNGEKPYSDSDIFDAENLLNSCESDGEYFIFSCCCGIPECSGWKEGIKVIHTENIVKWTDSDNNKVWHFDKKNIEEDLKNINEEVNIFKKYFAEKEIEYVGFGYNL
ncbi:hypothetical protein SD960_18300 [Flavobacterium sp. MMLR14_040]|uniref:hypothetical protein n=1 Tax=Flavobacterium sp. MMLR14_040 TaxID=3093843 RepID=UPI002990122E|nr:hypothetical protein [Flavobacterium sp. MMLR14_040]MDW8852061.1 hypothetical protein [Flavobacterium sp. MMLR14_040]